MSPSLRQAIPHPTALELETEFPPPWVIGNDTQTALSLIHGHFALHCGRYDFCRDGIPVRAKTLGFTRC